MSPAKAPVRPKRAKRRRAGRSEPRASYATVTYDQARAAATQGAAVRARQAAAIGRARPANRDPELVKVSIRTRLVRAGAKVIDRDPTLVAWLAERVEAAQRGPGRPGALSLRTALICYWLLAVTKRDFHLVNLPELLSKLHWRVRRQLGIDYLDSTGAARQLAYGQLLRVFHNVADALDPFAPGLTDEQAAQRAADLQELANRLVRASIEPGNLVHNGDYAVDATLKWSWDRPRRGRSGKIERRGRDGDAGRPLSLSEVIDVDEDDFEGLEEAGFVRDPFVAVRRANVAEDPTVNREERAEESACTKKRSRKGQRLRTWGKGSAWVGRRPGTKSVYGIALHTVTLTDPSRPALVEAMVVTPAPALPSQATIPLLAMLAAERAGTATPLGHVVADPLYSAHPPDWQLPLRALGGSAIFRLHRGTHQEGKRAFGHDLFIDGRPYCECAHDALPDLRHPLYLSKAEVVEEYQAQVMLRRPFEMLANGPFRPNGDRQFFYPHWNKDRRRGGCPHCVRSDGTPVSTRPQDVPGPRAVVGGPSSTSPHDSGSTKPSRSASPRGTSAGTRAIASRATTA